MKIEDIEKFDKKVRDNFSDATMKKIDEETLVWVDENGRIAYLTNRKNVLRFEWVRKL